ncbi:nitrite reductase small subunit NirD [Paenibacillus doosanensis]|uniref:nitrite reductase small subunit NirD n=1 Tax=Paenibacillus doosanensis TaxID=1229154 RepID=UPI00217F8C38|nr:nitrite reductase small subunit NirD [Paenibacillus doosanensis]MCS7461518.1 nitrite reductase small subunit NirD [Paenibacillus doosanensis]
MELNTLELRYVEIGALAQFKPFIGKEVRIGEYSLAVFRASDGKLFALENRTPHKKGGPLTEAIVSGHTIYCPLRDLHISLEDGKVLEPDTGEVQTYPVVIENEVVKIGLPETIALG